MSPIEWNQGFPSANNWLLRDAGSRITFGLFFAYLLALTLKFQVPWLLVQIQAALVVVLTLRIIFGLRTIRLTETQLVVLAILVLTVCATIAGQAVARQGLNLQMVPQVSRFVVIAIVAVLELDTVERLRSTLAFVTAIAATIGLLSVVNVFVPLPFAFTGQVRPLGPDPFSFPRSLGIWMSFGSYGVLAAIGVSYSTATVLWPSILGSDGRQNRRRVFAAGCLLLILVGIYLGKSRSTLLAFAAIGAWMLAVAAFHSDRELRADWTVVPRLIVTAGLVVGLFASRAALDIFIGANPRSVTGRLDQYQYAVSLMLQRPVLGWGWEYFEVAFGTQYTVHNLWLLVGVSLGIPVFLLWVYLFTQLGLAVFRCNVSNDRRVRLLGVIGTGLFLGGVVELALYPGFTPAAAILIGVLVAIAGRAGGT